MKIYIVLLIILISFSNNIKINSNMPEKIVKYYAIIKKVSEKTGIDRVVLLAVAERESRFDLKLFGKSHKGAVGLMGITKICWQDLKKDSDLNKYTWQDVCNSNYVNVLVGAKYLKKLMDKFNNDYGLALMAYNAGPADVKKLYAKYGSYDKIIKRLRKIALEKKQYGEKAFYADDVLRFMAIYKAMKL